MEDYQDELSQFDDAFEPEPSAGRTPGPEVLPDGDYKVQIRQAWIDRSRKQGRLMLHMGLAVLEGEMAGQQFERVTFLETRQNIAYLGKDLLTLGFDTDQWKVENGRPFSKELDKVLPRLKGRCFLGKKVTDGEYHNLFINQQIRASDAPPTTTYGGESKDDDFLPPF